MNSSLAVDDVLAVVRERRLASGIDGAEFKVELERAVARLAGRIEAVVRERVRPVSAQARSQAVRTVLRSSVLPREAVLALPAFAVFGPDATAAMVAAPRYSSNHAALADSGGDSGEERAARLRSLLMELVDPSGDAPGAWNRLAAQDVANRGKDAWRSVRAVLADAGIQVENPPA